MPDFTKSLGKTKCFVSSFLWEKRYLLALCYRTPWHWNRFLQFEDLLQDIPLLFFVAASRSQLMILLSRNFTMITRGSYLFETGTHGGTWVVQSVKCLPLAQVMIPGSLFFYFFIFYFFNLFFIGVQFTNIQNNPPVPVTHSLPPPTLLPFHHP